LSGEYFEAELLCRTADGRQAAELRLFCRVGQSIPAPFVRLSPRDAKLQGEEPLQILEGISYEYHLRPSLGLLRVRENAAIHRSLVPSGAGDRGFINPRLFIGQLPIVLEDQNGKAVASAAVEVRPSKIDYRADYRDMLSDIGKNSVDLLLDIRGPSKLRLGADVHRSAETAQQQLIFLQSVVYSREFRNAVDQIFARPHNRLVAFDTEQDIRKGLKATGTITRQIARGQPRQALPASHPLFTRLRNVGVNEPSTPRHLTVARTRETIDTYENRFVKYVLISWLQFVDRVQEILATRRPIYDAFIEKELTPLRVRLAELLARAFFKEIGEINAMLNNTPALQRKAGYREVLRSWMRFSLAAQLSWPAVNEAVAGGQRDIATLYEYWLFFKFIDLLIRDFKLDKSFLKRLVSQADGRFSMNLRSGEALYFDGGSIMANGRQLKVQFSYNRTFPAALESMPRSYPTAGSWTRGMRPDFTLSFWPAEFTTDQAERQELIVHVHFDAKYRVEAVSELFGESTEDLNEVKKEQTQGRYKRADLLKMHAYKDAIRRSAGAYVVYPGKANRLWYGYHEILPGLGAFAVRPGPSERFGTLALSNFLRQVVAHLADRASQRELGTYRTYETYRNPPGPVVFNLLPEKDQHGERLPPPSVDLVLIAEVPDQSVIDWTVTQSLAAIRLDIVVDAQIFLAHRALLWERDKGVAQGLWRILTNGVRLIISDELVAMAYPAPVTTHRSYALFKVERDPGFLREQWTDEDLKALSIQDLSKGPIIVTLQKLLGKS
jgi:predicted component of viral defense system (DUF524 family)